MEFHLTQHARLAIILGLSALVHLAILFVWQEVKTATNPTINRTLSVSLTRTLPAPAKSSPQTEPRIVKSDVSSVSENESTEVKIPQNEADDQYFSIGQLAHPPEMLNPAFHPLPNWPRQLHGEVIFRLWIDKNGRVNQIQPVTEGLSPSFIKAMRRYYLSMEYSAGYRPGGPVNSMIDITLNDTLAQ